MEKSYFVLYDINDNIVAYYDSFLEFYSKFNYRFKELSRKFRETPYDFIYLDIGFNRYKLFRFN